MGKEKREFLVLKDGQLMFYITNDKSVSDTQIHQRLLTAGYLTAIVKIAESASHGSLLSSMAMGNKHIFIQKGTFLPLIFVFVIHTNKVKEKKENKNFEEVIGEFESMFSTEQVEKWNGNVKTFASFNKNAQELF